MLRSLLSLFGGRRVARDRRTARPNSHRRTRKMGCQPLEDRCLLSASTDLFISEVHFDAVFGNDDQDQYLELRGAPGATIAPGTYFAVLESHEANLSDDPGFVHSVFDLSGLTLGSNGYLVFLQGSAGYATDPDATVLQGNDGFGGLPGDLFQDTIPLTNIFEFIFDSNTFVLLESPVPVLAGDDADADNDGELDGDAANWTVLDSVSVLGDFSGANDVIYADIAFRALGNTTPAPPGVSVVDVDDLSYVGRVGDSTQWTAADWVAGVTKERTANLFNFELTADVHGRPSPLYFAGRDLNHIGGPNFVATIRGEVYDDVDESGARDPGEPGLVDATVFLDRDGNGEFNSFQTIVEPDDFAVGTDLTNLYPGVTLTVQNSLTGESTDVKPKVDVDASTGAQVFANDTFGFFNDSNKLRMDFLNPAQSLSIDFIATSSLADYVGKLEVYDQSGGLLDTYLTAPLREAVETMTINRGAADIAYALAYSDPSGTPSGALDNLRFVQPEEAAVTQGTGDYSITKISDALLGSFPVRTVLDPGFTLSQPTGDGSHLVALGGAAVVSDVDFGRIVDPNPPGTPEDLLGNANGQWWVARFNGTGFTNYYWGAWAAATWLHVETGDVNGDGQDDVVGFKDNGQLWVGVSQGNGFVFQQWGALSGAVVWDDIALADVNGDGQDDVVARTSGDWWVAKSAGDHFVNEFWGRWSNAVTWQDVQVADVDGDDRDDIVGRANGQWWVAHSQGTFFSVEFWGRWSNAVTWLDVQVGDFNGDGRDDLIGRANGDWWIAESAGTYFSVAYWGRWSNAVTWEDVRVGDFNGDGNDDLAGRAGGNWWVNQSTGNYFLVTYWGKWSNAVTWDDVRVGDFNGDGLDDLVGRTSGSFWVSRSTGANFIVEHWGGWSNAVSWQHVLTGSLGE